MIQRYYSFTYFFVLYLAITSSVANASVSERDWKIAGDGLLTFDDVNNREWLDVPLTMTLPTPRYDNVVAELGVSGMFEGFTIAKSDDVIALAQSAGIDTSTADFDTNQSATRDLIDLLGETFTGSNGSAWTIGYLDEIAIGFPDRRLAVLIEFDPPDFFGRSNAGLVISSTDDFIRGLTTGVMVYRQAVPEPSALFSCSTCMLLLLGVYRSKRA